MQADTSADCRISRRNLLARGVAVAALPLVAHPAFARPRDEIDAFVLEEMGKAKIPGLALGVARRGAVQLTRGYGFADIAGRRPVTVDTMFHIASITKTVTAAAVVALADAGKFDLDEPVNPYLDFTLANPAHPDTPITFRHLLMHVSSISDQIYYQVDFRERGKDSLMPLADLLKAYLVPGGRYWSEGGNFSTAAPGSMWDYSNVGYGLLGYLVGRITGEDMRDHVRRYFFAPLGMRHSVWKIADVPDKLRATLYDMVEDVPTPVEPVGFPDWSSGMLRSSIVDLTRFLAAAANGGVADGARILSAAAAAQMLEMRTPAGLPDWLTGQGIGWMASELGGVPRINHWGGDPGLFTAAYLDPATRTGVAIFSNMSASAESRTAIKAIADRMLKL